MLESTIKKILHWLKNKLKEANAAGFVVGLSGGVDSAVVAILCKMSGKTLCLILPCETPQREIQQAMSFAKKFCLKTKMVDLTDVYRHLIKILPSANSADRIAKGNLKARLRMVALYYFANKENLIVAGTGNKSELQTGYFTKYGDGAVDILPIGNFTKSEVRQIAKYLNMPDEIVNKVPSAGLWPGQTDEGELGITYNELDKILEGKTKHICKEKILKIKKLIESTEHKRKMPEKAM